MSDTTPHKVVVWNRTYEVSIHRRGKDSWVAVGIYKNKVLRTESRTSGAVLKKWRQMALIMGNDSD